MKEDNLFFLPVLVGILTGTILGILIPLNISIISSKVLILLVLVGIDTIFCGLNAKISNEFNTLLFTNEFLLNSIISIGLVYLGDIMGLDLFSILTLILTAKVFYDLGKLNKNLFFNKQKLV
jgi:small basic protein